jgi:hypothetical protein
MRDKLRFLLRYAVLASSPCNVQPWLFRLDDDRVDVLPDRRRALPCADPDGRELAMSVGAVAGGFCLAAAHFGYGTRLELAPSAEVMARIHVLSGTNGADLGDRSLFLTLPNLRRHVLQFDAAVPSSVLLNALAASAASEGMQLHYAAEAAQRDALVALIGEAGRTCAADLGFRDELEHWSRPPTGDWVDGIPRADWLRLGSSRDFGAPEWSAEIGAVSAADLHAAGSVQRAGACPVLAVLSTAQDRLPVWVAAGWLLLRLELLARAAGVWLTDFDQVVQLPRLRQRLANILDCTGHPQAVIGLGYGAEVPPLPRRTIADMLVPEQSPPFVMH